MTTESNDGPTRMTVVLGLPVGLQNTKSTVGPEKVGRFVTIVGTLAIVGLMRFGPLARAKTDGQMPLLGQWSSGLSGRSRVPLVIKALLGRFRPIKKTSNKTVEYMRQNIPLWGLRPFSIHGTNLDGSRVRDSHWWTTRVTSQRGTNRFPWS